MLISLIKVLQFCVNLGGRWGGFLGILVKRFFFSKEQFNFEKYEMLKMFTPALKYRQSLSSSK